MPGAIDRLVPLVHAADVEASLAFYSLFGFEFDEPMRDEQGNAFFGSAAAPNPNPGKGPAEIMFARASAPIVPETQAVIFYLYTHDVAALRAHLLASGLFDGGKYCGQRGPNNGRRVVFEISYPDYMAHGELRIADPDGYCILVGQYE